MGKKIIRGEEWLVLFFGSIRAYRLLPASLRSFLEGKEARITVRLSFASMVVVDGVIFRLSLTQNSFYSRKCSCAFGPEC
jgi:hypothetical protein